MRPGRTGYSPLTIWTSVPQIVVTVMRINRFARSRTWPRHLLHTDIVDAVEDHRFHRVHNCPLSMRRGELLRRPPLDGPKKRHDRVDPHRRVGARILPAEHVAPDRHRAIAMCRWTAAFDHLAHALGRKHASVARAERCEIRHRASQLRADRSGTRGILAVTARAMGSKELRSTQRLGGPGGWDLV